MLRIMREDALLCLLQRRFVSTTTSRHTYRRYPNLLADRTLEAPDQAWVADITYIQLPNAFVYLVAFFYAHSRHCVGWHLSPAIDSQLTLAALERAITKQAPRPGLIHHANQGVQYASDAYINWLGTAGAQVSMAAVSIPYENTNADPFFRTLKEEEIYLNQYDSLADAETHVERFIADV